MPGLDTRLDRRRDLRGWALTPLLTLVLAPAVAGAFGLLLVIHGGIGDEPAVCVAAPGENRCEETTFDQISLYVAGFAALWLLLWLVPWWRGLRGPRIVLAIVAGAVLVIAPLRMI